MLYNIIINYRWAANSDSDSEDDCILFEALKHSAWYGKNDES